MPAKSNHFQPPFPGQAPNLQTTITPPGGSLTKHSTSLLMVAPKIPRPIIRGGISFDLLHPTRLLSVWQFCTNPTPSSALFCIRFSADRRYLASGCQQCLAQICDKVTGERTCVLVQASGLAMSAAACYDLAIGSCGNIS
ncbi:hypothetical protein JB92DRAFT_496847 [Gautieria morchelliformis]|nr:hypothetical protein JB92DRAFT_496847 [Gautieria morchelliformis]